MDTSFGIELLLGGAIVFGLLGLVRAVCWLTEMFEEPDVVDNFGRQDDGDGR